MNRDERLGLLAEALHTGWRKGTDADYAATIAKLIDDMGSQDWAAYVAWVDWCLGETGYRPGVEDTLKGLTSMERDLLRAVYRMQTTMAPRRGPGESGLVWVPLAQVAAELGRGTNGTSKTAGGLIRKELLVRGGSKATRAATYRLTPEGHELAGRGPAS